MSNMFRSRSPTFAMVGFEPSPASTLGLLESLKPKCPQQSMALQSQMKEMPPERSCSKTLQLSSSINNAQNKIASSVETAMLFPSTFPALPWSSPGSPSQDEAGCALELVMNFFEHQPPGVVDPQEYIALGEAQIFRSHSGPKVPRLEG